MLDKCFKRCVCVFLVGEEEIVSLTPSKPKVVVLMYVGVDAGVDAMSELVVNDTYGVCM